MLTDIDIAAEDPADLRAVTRLLAGEVKALTLKVEQLQQQLHGKRRHRFGSNAEGSDQLNLTFAEDEEITKAAREQGEPASGSTQIKPTRKHSRKPLPDHLDREGERLSPSEECEQCGGSLKTLGRISRKSWNTCRAASR